MPGNENPPETPDLDSFTIRYEKRNERRLANELRNYYLFRAACSRIINDPGMDTPRPRTGGKRMWMSPDQVGHLWNINLEQLLALTITGGLPAHTWNKETVSWASANHLRTYGLKDVIFNEVELFGFQCYYLEKIWNKLRSQKARSVFVKNYTGGALLLNPKAKTLRVNSNKNKVQDHIRRIYGYGPKEILDDRPTLEEMTDSAWTQYKGQLSKKNGKPLTWSAFKSYIRVLELHDPRKGCRSKHQN